MRAVVNLVLALLVLSTASAASAQEHTAFVQGFGGLRLGTVAVTNTAFGGVVGGDIIPGLQVIGEAGRLSDVLPNTVDTLLVFSPIGFQLSAWYAQGGVRITTPGRSPVRPYVETSAGIA